MTRRIANPCMPFALWIALVAPLVFPTPALGMEQSSVAFSPPVLATVEDGVPRFEPAKCGFTLAEGQKEGSNVFCGYVVVPEDHANLTGPTIRLAVARFTSATPEETGGPIIYLEGGPGVPSLDEGIATLASRYTPRYDFVAFDQRGVGQSEPTLTCPEVSTQEQRDFTEPLSAAEDQDHLVAAMLRCHDRLAPLHNLAAYTSAQGAADVNDIRIALGYRMVRLFGGSYGSRLALTVLRDFPHMVSSAVIDAVSPPQVDQYGETARSVDRAVRLLFDTCAADQACNGAFPTLPADFSQVIAQLDAEPLAIKLRATSGDPTILTGARFVDYVASYLYSATLTRYLPLLISQLKNRDTTLFVELVRARSGGSTSSDAMQWSVQCHDSVAFSSRDAAVARAQNLLPEIRKDFLPQVLSVYAICAQWGNLPPPPFEQQPVTSDIPTLVLSSSNDPVTPPAFAQAALQTLSHGIAIETAGIGHSVTGNASFCGVRMVTDFFAQPTARPDTSCTALLTRSFLANTKRYATPPPTTLDPSLAYTAVVTTTRGAFTVDLFADSAPNAVNSFVFLANDHFYDNMDVSRITAQLFESGDPTSLGTGGPGYTIKADPVPDRLDYDKYMIVMEPEDTGINGSRFIVLTDDWRGKFKKKELPIFGKVTSGTDVVDQIAQWDPSKKFEPRPRIVSVRIQVSLKASIGQL